MEIRTYRPEHVELRANTEHDKAVLSGYAVRFNSLSVPMDDGEGEFQERILPGAFTRTLESGPDIIALAHHDEKLVLGRRSVNTMKLVEDEHGLRTLIYPPSNTLGKDIVESVRRGDLSAMSFGFLVDAEEFRDEDGMVVREIKEATIFEVSIVAWPAYPSTSIKVRSDIPGKVKEMREMIDSNKTEEIKFPRLYNMMQMHAEKI